MSKDIPKGEYPTDITVCVYDNVHSKARRICFLVEADTLDAPDKYFGRLLKIAIKSVRELERE